MGEIGGASNEDFPPRKTSRAGENRGIVRFYGAKPGIGSESELKRIIVRDRNRQSPYTSDRNRGTAGLMSNNCSLAPPGTPAPPDVPADKPEQLFDLAPAETFFIFFYFFT